MTAHSAPASYQRPLQEIFQANSSDGYVRQELAAAATAAEHRHADALAPLKPSTGQLPSGVVRNHAQQYLHACSSCSA